LIANNYSQAFGQIVTKAGQQIRLRYFNQSIGSVWDDDSVLTISGADVWTSGIVMPLSTSKGTSDSILLEQGKLIDSDKRLFVNGSLLFTGSDHQLKIRIGSPGTDEWSLVPNGAIKWDVGDQDIYKKVFIRRLTNGSLLGE